MVSKVNRPSEDDIFKQMDFYTVYGPTIVATNTPVPARENTIISRLIPLHNVYKKKEYPEISVKDCQDLKDRMTAWRARLMDRGLAQVEWIDFEGRLWDMGKPLLQIIKAVSPKYFSQVVGYLRKIEKHSIERLQDSTEATILRVISYLSSQMKIDNNISEWCELDQGTIIDNV